MALVPSNSTLPQWTSRQSRGQFLALLWLRWRILRNGMRYRAKQRSVSGLVFIVLVRIIVWIITAAVLIGPILGCGFIAYFAIVNGHPGTLGSMFWTIFLLATFINVNVSTTKLNFDLTALLRFPIPFFSYLLMRIGFGLITIPTVVSNLCLAAAAIGIGEANHALFPWAALLLFLYALNNVFFTRMLLVWFDRWLATRRAREIFGGIVVALSLGFQFAVYSRPAGHGHAPSVSVFTRIFHPLYPVTQYLPPSLTASSILAQAARSHTSAFACFAGLLAFALSFLAIFALRLKKEFRGENLSDAAARAPRPTIRQAARVPELRPEAPLTSNASSGLTRSMHPAVFACLAKEFLYLRRSGPQLYALFTPLVFVFIIARRHNAFGGNMLFPYAVTYTLLNLFAGLYNILGADGPGFNLYLLAPVRFRDVLLAKNLVSSAVIAVEVLLTGIAVTIINGFPPSTAIFIGTLSWAAFALLTNLSIGNLRSLFSPMRFEIGKTRRPPASKGSGFIVLGVLLGSIALGSPIIYLCYHFNNPWLATPIFLLLTAGALAGYITVLRRTDSIAFNRRDLLTEALCKDLPS